MLSIEASRAIAAIAVVLMHASHMMGVPQFSGHVGVGRVFEFGYVGVDFFFVLSGFIITHVHFNEIGAGPAGVSSYLWRRFSRIYPIYWVVLGLSIALTVLARLQSSGGSLLDMGSDDVAGTVLLLIGSGEPKYVGVAWSLQYEVMFYLLFSVLLLNLRWGAGLLLVWATLIVGESSGLTPWHLPFHLGNAHCLEFLMGIGVGMFINQGRPGASRLQFYGLVLAFVLATVFEVYGPFARHGLPGRLALGLVSAALLLTLVALERADNIRTPLWLAKLGSVSYSIYLGHCLFIGISYTVLAKLGLYHRLPETAVFVIGVAAALSATTLLGLYVELPLVRLLKGWRVPRRAVVRSQKARI